MNSERMQAVWLVGVMNFDTILKNSSDTILDGVLQILGSNTVQTNIPLLMETPYKVIIISMRISMSQGRVTTWWLACQRRRRRCDRSWIHGWHRVIGEFQWLHPNWPSLVWSRWIVLPTLLISDNNSVFRPILQKLISSNEMEHFAWTYSEWVDK